MCKTSCSKCQRERWMQQILHKPRLSTVTPGKRIITLQVCRLLSRVRRWHPTHCSAFPPAPRSSSHPRQAAAASGHTFNEPSHPCHALESTIPGNGALRSHPCSSQSWVQLSVQTSQAPDLQAGCKTFEFQPI